MMELIETEGTIECLKNSNQTQMRNLFLELKQSQTETVLSQKQVSLTHQIGKEMIQTQMQGKMKLRIKKVLVKKWTTQTGWQLMKRQKVTN